MKINFNFKNLGQKLAKNLGWLFFAGFLLLVLFEAFEINASVQIILQSNEVPPAPIVSKGVRINFENYNAVVERIEHGDSFIPTGGINRDPFNPGFSAVSPAPDGSPTNPNDSSGVLQLR